MTDLDLAPVEMLRELQERSGATQAALAARFGVEQSTVSRWLTGESVPRSPARIGIEADWRRMRDSGRAPRYHEPGVAPASPDAVAALLGGPAAASSGADLDAEGVAALIAEIGVVRVANAVSNRAARFVVAMRDAIDLSAWRIQQASGAVFFFRVGPDDAEDTAAPGVLWINGGPDRRPEYERILDETAAVRARPILLFNTGDTAAAPF